MELCFGPDAPLDFRGQQVATDRDAFELFGHRVEGLTHLADFVVGDRSNAMSEITGGTDLDSGPELSQAMRCCGPRSLNWKR